MEEKEREGEAEQWPRSFEEYRHISFRCIESLNSCIVNPGDI